MGYNFRLMVRKKRVRGPLALILLAYLVITIGYGVVNPLFEAPDENWHYFTAQYIADTGQLPVVTEDYDPFLSQEAAQPPLYYGLGALLIGWIDTSQAREEVWPNPWAWAGDAAALVNYNQFVHTDREAWPWQGYVLATHLLRLFSTLLGLGTLICVYGCANLVFGTRIFTVGTPRSDEHGFNQYTNTPIHSASVDYPLLATALVAFWPQFNFVHASVTNDALITFLSAAAIWQLLKLWQLLGTQHSALSTQHSVLRKRFLLLGVTIAAAVLTKNAGTLLFLYALGFVMVLVWRRGEKWGWVAAALLIMLPVLLFSSWLWWRNWVLYGDPTAANVFVRLAGGDRNYTLWQVLAETPSLWTSLFALFGWFNVRAPDWVFWLWNGLVVVAGLGWLIRLVNSYQSSVTSHQSSVTGEQLSVGQRLVTGYWSLVTAYCSLFTLLAGWVLLIYAGLVSFMLRTPAAQGRLLFPALVPLVLGLVAGIRGWELVGTRRNSGELSEQLPVNSKQSAVGIAPSQFTIHNSQFTIIHSLIRFIPLLPLLTTLYCLLVVIPSAYARPRTVTALPTNVPVLQQEMSEGVFLVGGQIETTLAQPGDLVWLTLYWQAQTAPLRPTSQVIELFGPDLTGPLARMHSYHGRGMFPLTLWPVGAILADRFALRLDETVDAPVLAQAYVRLVGEEGVGIGVVKVVPAEWPTTPATVLARLGEGIELRRVEFTPVVAPGETITVMVLWTVAAAPQATYTTFVHLGDPAQVPLAVGDDQPRQGWYPTTIWQAGEVIPDQYTITVPTDLPPGDYPLVLGMYDAAANTRLPLTHDGQPQPYDAFFVGEIRVISNQ